MDPITNGVPVDRLECPHCGTEDAANSSIISPVFVPLYYGKDGCFMTASYLLAFSFMIDS